MTARFFDWIESIARDSFDPEQVAITLHQIAEGWPAEAKPLRELLETFPIGAAALTHLFAVSEVCRARLIQHPEALLWLAEPEVCGASRGPGRMAADLADLCGDETASAHNFRLLRVWKAREMTRIALRELSGSAPLEETMAELSQLAEICVAQVFTHWNAELRRRWGSPASEFAVLGLGKLGGRELNHSSDIDVIFLYSDEGRLTANFSYHEWFTRLANKMIDTFATPNSAGALFRIDLRLRPEGKAGPLVRSLESMEHYYAGFGETWERLALIKARWIAGDEEIAYEFLRSHQSFIFPKSPTPDLLDEIASIKRRIERDIVGHENLHRNVKLGPGGIREIEFATQALQLIHGARQTFLQETSTLKALRALTQLDFLRNEEATELSTAYRFLRRVEHRLQIEAEQQTHTVPERGAARDRLAASLGFQTSDDFMAELRAHMQKVRAIFDRIVQAHAAVPDRPEGELAMFPDVKKAAKSLAQLAQGAAGFHVAPRTRQVFQKLKPLLLQQLAGCVDAEGALNRFVRFVEAYGLRSLLFEMLAVSPRLLELVIKTFDASQSGGELLIRHPQLLEEITRGGSLDQSFTVAQHLSRLHSLGANAERLDLVRAYRQTELLRTLVRDIMGLVPLRALFAELTALAEACLIYLHELFDPQRSLTIIALGKFGGSELAYGADLDVLFIGEDARVAQNLIVAMAQPTSEGHLAVLDARLRPDGEKGALAAPLTAYGDYYRHRAQLWEIQALTRTRGIMGASQDDFIAITREAWSEAGQRESLFREIDAMLARIAAERGSGTDFLDFKTGRGGMVEAEFLVQALQMRHGVWAPNFFDAATLLETAGVFAEDDARELMASYETLRATESALRRWHNRGLSALPAAEAEQRALAVRAGSPSWAEFRERYQAAREYIHALYVSNVR